MVLYRKQLMLLPESIGMTGINGRNIPVNPEGRGYQIIKDWINMRISGTFGGG